MNELDLPPRYGLGLSGQNNPKQQYIISDIMFDIYDKLKVKATPELKIELNELNRRGNIVYVIPDIVIDNGTSGIVFIEICRKAMVSHDTAKLKKLMVQYRKPNEGFVYDYESSKWYKVVKGKGERSILNSKSDILQYEFKLY